MKEVRKPLNMHETRDLLLKCIMPAPVPSGRQCTEQERQEALWCTPRGSNPDAYIDCYFLSQQRVGNNTTKLKS